MMPQGRQAFATARSFACCSGVFTSTRTCCPPRLPQWLEQGAAAFTADDLAAVGKALCGKSVGDVEHGGWGVGWGGGGVGLLMAAVLRSLLRLVQQTALHDAAGTYASGCQRQPCVLCPQLCRNQAAAGSTLLLHCPPRSRQPVPA